MLRLSERAVRKILIDQRLYTAGIYAGKRDIYLQEARLKKRVSPSEILTISLLMRNARINHRLFWETLKRVRLANVVPIRIPTLQAG